MERKMIAVGYLIGNNINSRNNEWLLIFFVPI